MSKEDGARARGQEGQISGRCHVRENTGASSDVVKCSWHARALDPRRGIWVAPADFGPVSAQRAVSVVVGVSVVWPTGSGPLG